MKTRVAIVLPYFSNGGMQVMVSRLASHLDLDEVEAEVICIYGEPLGNWMEKDVLDHGIPIKYIGKSRGFSGGAILRLGKELSRFNPNIVHTHLSAGVYCAPWVLTHRAKMLHTVHNIPEKELIKPKRLLMKALYKTRRAIAVAISPEIRSLVMAYYRPRTEAELIFNPVDVACFAEVPKKDHENMVVVTAGRLSEQKNQALLIDAFVSHHSSYPEDELVILGDGPLRNELDQRIRKMGAESYIHLKGNVDNIPDYFGRADVFALSSNYEGLPLVVLEAMASSLPIVSTDVGGVRDLISGNGILVEPGKAEQLCDALDRLKKDLRMRKTMGDKSFELVRQYDSAIIAGEYTALYKKYS